MSIIRGNKSIGMSSRGAVPPPSTLPPAGEDVSELIASLTERMSGLEVLIEGKADANRLKSLIAFDDSNILIQAEEIGLLGNVTIANVVAHQNGTKSGELPYEITRIIGDQVQTGSIRGNSYGATQGIAIDLDNDQIIAGGSDAPSLLFENGNLTVSGTITASSFVQGKNRTLGDMADDIDDSIGTGDFEGFLDSALEAGVGNVLAGDGGDFILDVAESSIYARHTLFDENGLGSGYTGDLRSALLLTGTGIAMGYNRKSDGAFVPAVAIDSTGDISIRGTLTAGSVITGSVTVDGGSTLGTIDQKASDALPASSFDSTLQNKLNSGVGNVVAGSGGDYELEVTGTSIIAKHEAANKGGIGSGYSGDIRTGLIITGNGISMGYNRKSDGDWINAVAISSTGDVVIRGELTVGSVIAGTVEVDGQQISAIKSNASAGSSHAGQSGNPHGASLDQISGDLDQIADGSTYFKTNNLEKNGAGRAYDALNSSADYKRSISTQNITVSGSNPYAGVVIDQNGLRGYGGGDLKFEINASNGDATFSGDVVTGGQVISTGESTASTPLGTITGAIVANATGSNVRGVFAESENGPGIQGFSDNSSGVIATTTATSSTIYALDAFVAGGSAGAARFQGGEVRILGGDLNLTSGGVAIGGASQSTSRPALYLSEESAPGSQTNQIAIYGALVGSDTSLGMVTERAVESGTGAFAGINQLRVRINGTNWNLPLEAA